MAYPKFLTSSLNPQALSLTVRGALLAVLPLIIMVTGLTEDEANSLVDAVQQIVFNLATVVSVGMIAAGLVRKVLVAWKVLEPREE